MLSEPAVQSRAVASNRISASDPDISDEVLLKYDSPPDAINAAESLPCLHNVVSPKISSHAKKRKSTISTDALKLIIIEELGMCFLVTLWSCYHQTSISHMIVNIGMHQYIHLLFETSGGRKGCAKITSSFNAIKPGNASTWTDYYEEILHIKEL